MQSPGKKYTTKKKSKIKIESNDQTVRTTLAPLDTPEHTKIYSRTLRRDMEIGVGMHGTDPKGGRGGLVPKNPFASAAQRGYMHAHPEVLGKTALDEWDASSKGQKVPYHVKKK
jgi:hypothetical protein